MVAASSAEVQESHAGPEVEEGRGRRILAARGGLREAEVAPHALRVM